MSELEFEYDDVTAVKFIQNYLPQELKERFTDDDVYYILDVIYDFYEKNDYLDEEDEGDEEKELLDYIIQQAKKDRVGEYSSEEILFILRAENAYMDTLIME